MANLTGRSLLTLKDFTADEINYLIDFAIELKTKNAQESRVNFLIVKILF